MRRERKGEDGMEEEQEYERIEREREVRSSY